VCREHAHVLRTFGLDVNHPSNLILMPTSLDNGMHLRPTRLVHNGGHPSYNRYVLSLLLRAVCADDVIHIQAELKRRIRSDDPTLDWI
jgi:hypothetical protein